MKPAFGPGQHDQVAGMQVGVEEAVLVDHPDDGLGAEVDQPLAVLERHRLHAASSPAWCPSKNSIVRTRSPLNSRKIFGKTMSGSSAKLAAKVSALSASRRRSTSRRV